MCSRSSTPILLPAPDEVLRAGIKMAASGELLKHIAASLSRVLWGFGIAAALGIVVGIALGRSRLLEHLVEPTLEMLPPHPAAGLPADDGALVRHRRGIQGRLHRLCGFLPHLHDHDRRHQVRRPPADPRRPPASAPASGRSSGTWSCRRPRRTSSRACGWPSGCRSSSSWPPSSSPPTRGLGFLINDARTFFLVSNMLLGAAVIGIIGVLANVPPAQARRPPAALAR